MKNKEIFDDLAHADDDMLREIAELCEPLDKASDRRIFKRIQSKCSRSSAEGFETENANDVRGVDIYMRPKWYKPVMAAAAAVVLIAGIAGSMTLMKTMKKTSPDTKANSSYSFSGISASSDLCFYDLRYRAYDKGCTYQAGDKLYYLDFETMEKTAFCAKPNCTHNSSECLARQAKNGVVHGGYVYFFTADYGMKETKEGKPVFEMASKLMRSSLDSSETELVCSFNDAIPRYEDAIVIDGDTLYFNAYDPSPEVDDTVGATYTNGQGYAYLCSVDLDSGEYTNYGVICCEEDYGGRKSSRVYMIGADNGRIYMDYQFIKDKNGGFTHYNYEFDLETKQYSRSELPAGICAAKGVYVWLDDEGDKLHVIKDGKDNIFDYTNFSNAGYVFGSKVFVSGNWVDLADMTIHSCETNMSPVAYYNGCYIFAENSQFKKLTEEELLALDKNSGSSDNSRVQYIADNRDYYENGVVYGKDIAMYLDFETMAKAPLCSKPNCTHTTSSCLANMLGTSPVFYNDYVYFFQSNNGAVREKADEIEFYITSKLMRASLKDSEVEEVCRFELCPPQKYGRYVLDGSLLYLVCDDLNPTKSEYGTYSWGNSGGTHYLCSIDLDSGKFTNYGSIYEDDKKDEGAKNSSSAIIAGIYNGKMQVMYGWIKNIIEDTEELDLESLYTFKMFEFDLDTKTLSESELPYSFYMNDDTYVSYNRDSKTMEVLYNGKQLSFPCEKEVYSRNCTEFNGKLFQSSTGKWYDLSDESEHSMEKYKDYKVVAYYKGSYILISGGLTEKLTEEELLALDKK